jgi:hypothetical protein
MNVFNTNTLTGPGVYLAQNVGKKFTSPASLSHVRNIPISPPRRLGRPNEWAGYIGCIRVQLEWSSMLSKTRRGQNQSFTFVRLIQA